MKRPSPFEAYQAQAGAVFDEVAAPVRAAQVLDGGEIIEMSIKPSLWFIPIVSGRFVASSVALIALLFAVAPVAQSTVASIAVIGAGLAALTRVALASLQWASRLFVLTNRRVLRFSGVSSVQIRECDLVWIARAELRVGPVQRWLGLGSIRVIPRNEVAPRITWEHVPQAALVHERLMRAIRRTQDYH